MLRAFLALSTVAALTSAVSGAAPRSTSVVVAQKDKQFSQSEIHVHVGDTVVFVNNDAVTHNVFSSTDGFQFNLKRQPPKAETRIPFTTRGTAAVQCAFHPTMKLSVVVD